MSAHFILQCTDFVLAQSYRVLCETALYYNEDAFIFVCIYMYLNIFMHMNGLIRLLVIAYHTRSLDNGLLLSQ